MLKVKLFLIAVFVVSIFKTFAIFESFVSFESIMWFFLNLQGPTENHFRDVGSLYEDCYYY